MSAATRPPFPFRRPSLLTIIKRDSRATPVDKTPGSKRMCFSQTGCHSPNIGGMNEPHPQHPTRHKPDLYNTAIDLRRPFMKRKTGTLRKKLNVPPQPSIPEPKQGRRRQTRELIGERLRHTLNPVQRGHSVLPEHGFPPKLPSPPPRNTTADQLPKRRSRRSLHVAASRAATAFSK